MTTIGTRLFTLLRGRLIGKDADGRAYYQDRRVARPGNPARRVRRWVIYRPGEDASAVPAEWWNWLHYADDAPLPQSVRKPWQLPFQPNLTATRPAIALPAAIIAAVSAGRRPATMSPGHRTGSLEHPEAARVRIRVRNEFSNEHSATACRTPS